MMRHSKHRPDYFKRIVKICDSLGCSVEQFPKELKRMYIDELMSAREIAELLSVTQKVTAKTIERWLDYVGVDKRSKGDAFRLAVSRGRVNWHKKDPDLLARRKRIGGYAGARLRYAVLERDKFACVVCGSTAREAPLEVDHVLAIVLGGTNDMENLQTLCEICNVGKQRQKNEQ